MLLLFVFKEHENQNRQQKDYRNRIESLFEWLKQTHRYEPLTDKRDLDSLQREHTRLLEKRQHIDEKAHDIDALLRAINRFVHQSFDSLSQMHFDCSFLLVLIFRMILCKDYVKN